MARRNRNQHSENVWPGFVDAISTLLLLFVFMMALFSVISFSLGQSLSGKKKELSSLASELSDAENQADSLKGQVGQYKDQVSGLSTDLQKAKQEQEALLRQLSELIGLRQDDNIRSQDEVNQLNSQIVALEATRKKLLGDITNLKDSHSEQDKQAKLTEDELNQRIAALTQEIDTQKSAAAAKSQAQINAEAEIITLRNQIGTLTSTLQNVETALAARDDQIKEQKIEISSLGNRINEALTSEVNRLQEYRSEFFGKLKQTLGNNDDIRIEGDRFVISSGVLFSSASANLGGEGIRSVNHLAGIIKSISKEIPSDIDWVIRVDGHTDNIPYKGMIFKDNWELSSARALSVVHQLIGQGVDPKRLIAAGFGEFHPISTGNTNADHAKNRRIEIKLTQK
ncbi:MAG: OmpA family protein [Alphaproteobacteria bacterium]